MTAFSHNIVITTIGEPNKIVAVEFLAYMVLSAYLKENGIKKAHIDAIVRTYLKNINFEDWDL